MSAVSSSGWKNKEGTSDRKCNCGSWKQHWINNTDKSWPPVCSINECEKDATLGAHVYNPDAEGEYIVPACELCNQITKTFDLKSGVTVVSANKSETCSK